MQPILVRKTSDRLLLSSLVLLLGGCSGEGLQGAELDAVNDGMGVLTFISAGTLGAISAFLLRALPHRKGVRFPDKVRRWAGFYGLSSVMLWHALYAFEGWRVVGVRVWSGGSVWLTLQHGLLLMFFVGCWYGVTWFGVRMPPRWSGSLALGNFSSERRRQGRES